jgi:putative ABC transport system permease protein
MLSYGYWKKRHAGDAGVVGRSMKVEGTAHTIVGVLPASFEALAGMGDIVVSTALPPISADDGANYMAIARLADGASMAAVSAEVDARLHAMDQATATNRDGAQRTRYGVERLDSWQHRGTRPILMLFLVSALLVLLIALVNLANLMLLRSLSRSHDAAVRSALGAPMLRLILPALGEGLLIGAAGALLGMVIAAVGLTALQGFIPYKWLPDGQLWIGVLAWVLALAIGLLGALLAAALGLWRSRAATTIDELREGGRSGNSRHGGRLGRALVVAQVALAVVLLCTAGMFMRALYEASQLPLGFTGDNLLTFELAPVMARYPDAAAVDDLSRTLVQRLQTIPGVVDAAVTTNLPTSTDVGSFGQFSTAVRVPGGTAFNTQYHGVGPDFFKLFAITLHEGRAFTRGDMHGGEPVAIVSQNLADANYGGHALGKVIQVTGRGSDVWPARIVGVANDTYQLGPLQPKQPVLYVPLAQVPEPLLAVFRRFEPLRFVLRGHVDPIAWDAGIRMAVAEVAPEQPITNVRTMHSIVQATTADVRLNLLLAGVFASLALLLAVAGMYAVMAVAVAAREREFGVRTALGASSSRLVRLVLCGALAQVALGLLVGVAITMGLSQALSTLLMSLLGESRPFDPLALTGVCVVLAAAGLLACFVPALRAGRVHPMRALRGE